MFNINTFLDENGQSMALSITLQITSVVSSPVIPFHIANYLDLNLIVKSINFARKEVAL